MAFCTNCGASIGDGSKFCPSCGATVAPTAQSAAGTPPPPAPSYGAVETPPPPAPSYGAVGTPPPPAPSYAPPTVSAGVTYADPADVQANKAMAILAYIFFFVPLLAGAHKTSPYVRYHANQGTVLFISGFACGIALSILSAVITGIALSAGLWTLLAPLSALFAFLWFAVWALILVFVILGIVAAVNGQLKPLPIIGKFQLIK